MKHFVQAYIVLCIVIFRNYQSNDCTKLWTNRGSQETLYSKRGSKETVYLLRKFFSEALSPAKCSLFFCSSITLLNYVELWHTNSTNLCMPTRKSRCVQRKVCVGLQRKFPRSFSHATSKAGFPHPKLVHLKFEGHHICLGWSSYWHGPNENLSRSWEPIKKLPWFSVSTT